MHANKTSGIKITEPAALSTLRQAVSGELREGAQIILLLTMSRSSIMALVLTQAATAGVIGAAVGLVGGLVFTYQTTGAIPSALFTLSVGTLAVLTAALGATLPALIAANADPVRIVRVP